MVRKSRKRFLITFSLSREIIVKKLDLDMLMNLHVSDLFESEKSIFEIMSASFYVLCAHENSNCSKLQEWNVIYYGNYTDIVNLRKLLNQISEPEVCICEQMSFFNIQQPEETIYLITDHTYHFVWDMTFWPIVKFCTGLNCQRQIRESQKMPVFVFDTYKRIGVNAFTLWRHHQ